MKIASSLPIAAIVLLAAAFLLPVRVVITVVVCFVAFSPLSPLHGAVHRALLPRCVSDTFFPLADPLVSAAPLSAGSSHTQGDATCKDKRGIFDLTHVVLSFDMDRSQWGNLGYWSAAQPPSYPDACAALASVVFSAAEIAAHDSVLAVGCGSGDELLLLKAGPKKSDPGREWQRPRVAVGVNIAPAQVREAQRRVSAQDATTRQLNGQGPPCCDDQEECEVRVYEGSADNLTPILDAETAIAAASAPVPSAGLFNAVVCIDTAYHFPSRPRFLSSALNALTPGGRIAFTDLLLPPSALSPDVRAGKGVRGMFYAWGMPAVSKAMSIPRNSVLTEEQMHAAMEAAGFVDVKVERIDQHVFQGFADFIERHVTLWGPTVRPLRWAKFLLTALALRAVVRTDVVRYGLVSGRRPA